MNTDKSNDISTYSTTPHKLVIAEKPSVSRSLATVIGATQKHNGYLEGNGYLVSWCVGHLVELALPSAYDEKYAKWRGADLPILPEPWQYTVCEGTKAQFGILKHLMDDTRVGSIICATDAGREGELIFRLVYDLCECRKPVERLWISSMEEAAIREGFEHLKPSTAYDALYQAALCRAQADWLVGINATRLFSTMYGKTLNIGRVMTPTLSMIVNREVQIAAFQPTVFYHAQLDCGGFTAQSERLPDRGEAERIAALCMGKEAKVVSVEKTYRPENPPRLYDLTSLQRDANRLLGYTAQQTLDYAQALYEKKFCTYPRTDSRYLTEHMEASTLALADMVAREAPFHVPAYITFNPARVIDGGKVSDHHAILPTSTVAGADLTLLPSGEQNILILIMVRLLCAMCEPSRKEETVVSVECEGVLFTVKGSYMVDHGWRAVDSEFCAALFPRKSESQEPQAKLPPKLDKGVAFTFVTTSVKEGQTSPPRHLTEDTLLSAMETAGQRDAAPDSVFGKAAQEDAPWQNADHRKGLGTPATRAGILEKLVKTGFVERKGAKKATVLLPTDKGASLIAILPEELQSPVLTAEWEQRLRQIERGELEPEAFMRDIHGMVKTLVNTSQPIRDAHVLFPDDRENIGTCPRCGGAVLERPKSFSCASRECGFALWKDNRFFTSKRKELTTAIAAVLLKEGRVKVKGLYSEKTGKTYDATVVLDDTGGQYVNFKLEF
jgi:DNA topoisomerase-3